MGILGMNHMVKILVQASILITYYQLVLAPAFSRMMYSLFQNADLVCLIISIIQKSNFKLMVGGKIKLNG